MRHLRKPLAGLVALLVVFVFVATPASAGTPGSVTLKVKTTALWAEAHVYATIFYDVQYSGYGLAKFAPLGEPYNYVHFGSHSGSDGSAYWKSNTMSTSEYSHHASGWWHVSALWKSKDGTMDLWLAIEYSGAQPLFQKGNYGVDSLGIPMLLVRYTVDDTEGNTLADEVKDIAVGAIVDYIVSAG